MNKRESGQIITYFGGEFHEHVVNCLDKYAVKWDLDILRFVPHLSMSCIFFCRSARYGDAALKISSNSDKDFRGEYNVLREYGGGKFCNVYDCDREDKVMLLEQITPGIELAEEKSLVRRMDVFSGLFNRLHKKPSDPALFQTYGDKLCGSVKYFKNRDDLGDLYVHLMKAIKVYDSVSAVYSTEMLLHGDLHAKNILSRGNGGYVIIDPQGLAGDPVFDIPRFIMAEYYGYVQTIEGYNANKEASLEQRAEWVEQIIKYFSNSLGVPQTVVRQCFYIEVTLYECWSASVGGYDIDNPLFAEMITNRYN